MKFSKEGSPLSINQTYDIGYWARNWKVSVMQIAEAIRNTGSNRLRDLKRYLKESQAL